MTVTGADSIIKGEISHRSNRLQSEGSKVHRGMIRIRKTLNLYISFRIQI
jgi:hypothetical protein